MAQNRRGADEKKGPFLPFYRHRRLLKQNCKNKLAYCNACLHAALLDDHDDDEDVADDAEHEDDEIKEYEDASDPRLVDQVLEVGDVCVFRRRTVCLPTTECM